MNGSTIVNVNIFNRNNRFVRIKFGTLYLSNRILQSNPPDSNSFNIDLTDANFDAEVIYNIPTNSTQTEQSIPTQTEQLIPTKTEQSIPTQTELQLFNYKINEEPGVQ